MPETAVREVTSLRRSPRAPGRVVVYVDEKRFATLPEPMVRSLGLVEGLELDEAGFEQLRDAADAEAAFDVAVRLLAVRPRAVQELLLLLRSKGHKPNAAAHAVGRLEDAQLLDDNRFAEEFVRSRLARGHGPDRMLRDLLRKGVSRATARNAIDEVMLEQNIDQRDMIRELALKRARQLDGVPAEKKFNRPKR